MKVDGGVELTSFTPTTALYLSSIPADIMLSDDPEIPRVVLGRLQVCFELCITLLYCDKFTVVQGLISRFLLAFAQHPRLHFDPEETNVNAASNLFLVCMDGIVDATKATTFSKPPFHESVLGMLSA